MEIEGETAMFKSLLITSALTLLCLRLELQAEVEQVILTWNPIPCNYACPKNLQDRLQKAKGVASVDMQASDGRAIMVWDTHIPFSFVPLNFALRYVGVREKSLRVKVSGYVHGSGANYSITSRGDNTNFVLFNRAVPANPPQYNNLYNPTNRVLSKDQIAKLEDAKKGKQVVVIEGPIFMPERSPPDPLQLVIENISIEAPKEKPKASPLKSQQQPGFGTSQNTPAKS
jgi:hypothetical protein